MELKFKDVDEKWRGCPLSARVDADSVLHHIVNESRYEHLLTMPDGTQATIKTQRYEPPPPEFKCETCKDTGTLYAAYGSSIRFERDGRTDLGIESVSPARKEGFYLSCPDCQDEPQPKKEDA